MKEWVKRYVEREGVDEEGRNIENQAVNFIRPGQEDCNYYDIKEMIKEVIDRCSTIDREVYLSENNFKKLRMLIVNTFGFTSIDKLQSKNKYKYIIFILKDYKEEFDFRNMIAHEIAHFWFALQNKKFNFRVKNWNFEVLWLSKQISKH